MTPLPTTLAIDTSTAQGSVAVARNGDLFFQTSFISERSHNSQLFAPLAEALRACGSELERIVVGLGPGSYTGVRIGIAAAQGLAWSRHVPVVGLPSVIAPETGGELPEEFVMCGDARRGMYFRTVITQGRVNSDIETSGAEAFTLLREADAIRPWYTFDGRSPLGLPGIKAVKPSAALLAQRGAELRDEDVFLLEERPLEPVYLAAPFITQPKPRASSPIH